MQNRIFNQINVSSKLLILLLVILGLIISNSFCFILTFSIFLSILLIFSNRSVKYYVDLLKNIKLLLLFALIAYIIMGESIFEVLLSLYKLILIIFFVNVLFSTISFQGLINGIKTLLKPLNNKFNIDNVSLNIALFIYFIGYYINSKEFILSKSLENKKYFFDNIFIRLFFTNYKLKKIETDLKLKFFVPNFEENNKNSNIAVFIVLILLILVILREVII